MISSLNKIFLTLDQKIRQVYFILPNKKGAEVNSCPLNLDQNMN